MSTVYRWRTYAEQLADLKAHLEALVDGDGADRFTSVVYLVGANADSIVAKVSSQVRLPAACILRGGSQCWDEKDFGIRAIGWNVFLLGQFTGNIAGTAGVVLDPLIEAVEASFYHTLEEGHLADEREIHGVKWRVLGTRMLVPSGERKTSIDMAMVALESWDYRRNRDSETGVPS